MPTRPWVWGRICRSNRPDLSPDGCVSLGGQCGLIMNDDQLTSPVSTMWKLFVTFGRGWRTLHCHCSVAKLCPTLCDPLDCSTPGFPSFPVLHYLQEFAQMHVHWVGDAIQPSIFLRIRVFSSELALHIRWPKYWFHLPLLKPLDRLKLALLGWDLVFSIW